MLKYQELQKILQRNCKIPYPKVPKLYKNSRYCGLVYNAFAGREEGELTATLQYIYEHIYLQKHSDISRILKEIAIQEMQHLNILGEIIVNLGGKPIYQNSNNEFWNACNVNYKFSNIEEAMKINIRAEEMAIKNYQLLWRYTNNPYLRKVYERIILDEKVHLEIFKNLK